MRFFAKPGAAIFNVFFLLQTLTQMHFLTPHVEISMADNNENNNNSALRMQANTNGTGGGGSVPTSASEHPNSQQPTTVTATTSTGLDIQAIVRPMNSNGSPSSPQSADSNSNVPSSSHSSIATQEVQSSRHLIFENAIKPSISLIPIKQVKCRQLSVVLFLFLAKFSMKAWLL